MRLIYFKPIFSHNNGFNIWYIQPFRKPNDNPLYINSKSNHPHHIIKNLPITIKKILAEIASNENFFNIHKKEYQGALINSGYNINLNLKKQKTRNNRNRNVLWYNPPFNLTLKTILQERHFWNSLNQFFLKTSN